MRDRVIVGNLIMSHAQRIEVLVTLPLFVAGAAHELGTKLQVEPLVAAQLLSSGRARLVNASDVAAINLAQQEHNKQVCPLDSPRGTSWQIRSK